MLFSLKGLVPSSGREHIWEICLTWKANSTELLRSIKATLLWIMELYRFAIADVKFEVLMSSSHTNDIGSSTGQFLLLLWGIPCSSASRMVLWILKASNEMYPLSCCSVTQASVNFFIISPYIFWICS